MIPHMYPDWQILTSSTASTPKSFLFLPLPPSIYSLHSSRTSLLNHIKEHHSLLKTSQYTPLGLKCHFFLGDFPYYIVKIAKSGNVLYYFYLFYFFTNTYFLFSSFIIWPTLGMPASQNLGFDFYHLRICNSALHKENI